MTNKELLYIEDALGHETFMKSCSTKTSAQLKDPALSAYIAELEKSIQIYLTNFLIYYRRIYGR